jgi:hypothetical protein
MLHNMQPFWEMLGISTLAVRGDAPLDCTGLKWRPARYAQTAPFARPGLTLPNVLSFKTPGATMSAWIPKNPGTVFGRRIASGTARLAMKKSFMTTCCGLPTTVLRLTVTHGEFKNY